MHAVSEIHSREGLRAGFFSGLWPTVAKGAINNCIRFGLYNEAAEAFRRSRGEAPDQALGPTVAFGLGAAAGAVSAVSRSVTICFSMSINSYDDKRCNVALS